LKNSKMVFKSFKKIRTNNLDIDNYGIYYCAKTQSKTRCMLDLAKNDKCMNLVNSAQIQSLKFWEIFRFC
jgi:hypothetical protein